MKRQKLVVIGNGMVGQAFLEYLTERKALDQFDITVFCEEPPIASAMPAFSAYLCAHEHIKQGTHTFVIDRGSMDKRKSVLNIEMDNKLEEILTIRVGGPAIITGEGMLLIPDSEK